jgi:putative Mg2+ transporter-C (MgtC) family protein
MNELEFLARLGVGVGCGIAIGAERQWRQRMAGLRTNALVAAGACLFVLLQEATPGAGSADRIAAQVVTGVGFLGAGVIIRDGLNIRGVNTAATLWCAAAVGALAGSGLLSFAAIGAGVAVLANLALRPLARAIDRQPLGASEVETTYEFRAACRAKFEATVRALIVQAFSGEAFQLRGVHSEDVGDGTLVEVHATLLSIGTRNDALLESAVSRLSLQTGVTAVAWEVVPPDTADGDGVPSRSLNRWRFLFRGLRSRDSS